MKIITRQKSAQSILAAAAVLFGLAYPVEFRVRCAEQREATPMDQIGEVAGKQYSGDGLSVSVTANGARLRCVFQSLDGDATSEGLWLTSTATNTMADRFRVKAAVVGREAAGQTLNNQSATSSIQLPATGNITLDGQKVRFTRPGLLEEYSVSLDGVRQDFVVTQRPGGLGDLQVRLDVTGARVEPAACGAQLVLEKSGRKIAYSRLRVTDAHGRELQARIEVISAGDGLAGLKPNAERGKQQMETSQSLLTSAPTGRELAVVVDDADAAYPLRIDPTFSDANWVSLGGIPGANGHVKASVVDGAGNLYIGGDFTMAGDTNVNYIAKWNGSRWSPLGSGMDYYVDFLAVSGTNVYAGGEFKTAGGIAANSIAKWNGNSWAALGLGLDGDYPYVATMAVSGSNVYVGGNFTTAGGMAANNIARWNGSSWTALGSGTDNAVGALAVSGSNVYVGGNFTTAGGVAANYIAKWDGVTWSALGSGMNFHVYDLAVSGTNVYAGGAFSTAGGISANRIAKWDGNGWSALYSGVGLYPYYVESLALSGTNLYAGGYFTNAGGILAYNIAKWNGSTWSALGLGIGGVYPYVATMVVSGTNVYAGGGFTTAGGRAADNIAKWNGSTWSALSSGLDNTVYALAVSGTNVYAGGDFTTSAGSVGNYIAKWNGSSWSALGSGMNYPVYALAVSGTNVYAGGGFTAAGGTAANYIAKWNGNSWSALGSGMSNGEFSSPVYALAVSGTNVYAGGGFTAAGGTAANYIAKWNGNSWSALGSGMSNWLCNGCVCVYALAVSGSNLYAGGVFTTAGDSAADSIAKWNGTSWSGLGSGMGGGAYYPPKVSALTVSGSDLYAGGDFTTAGGGAANYIAKWDGNSWSGLGLGVNNSVNALVVSGSNVYAGGMFTNAGGSTANYIAKWDGSSWSALGSGMNNKVYALAVSGSDLYAAGSFTMAGGKVSGYLAKAVSANYVPLVIASTDGRFGFTNRQFRFTITGPAGSNAVIQASSNLQTWIPLQTNALIGGTLIFTDSQTNSYLWRCYRAVLFP